MAQEPFGVHIVGSIPLPNATDALTRVCSALPNRLRRIPDGETGPRLRFTMFQRQNFSSFPQVLRQWDSSFNSIPVSPPTTTELEEIFERLKTTPLQTKYDSFAIESYAIFSSLRSSGKVPAGVKFQVCLPTTVNFMCLLNEGYQVPLEPFYEAALLNAVQNICASIPHEDLAIQWDMAVEFAMLEGVTWPHFGPWFTDVREGIISRAVKVFESVPKDVECGLHLCYGDIGHRHFIEPKSMCMLVGVVNDIISMAKRPLTWVQMPVPKERHDEAYFAPLKDLKVGDGTEVYLGLVHYGDLEGTKKRIETAKSVLSSKNFGVGTECGMGRTPPDQLDGILEICRTVTGELLAS